MAWEKINDIFPRGYAITNTGIITVDEILAKNYDMIRLNVNSYCHDVLKSMEEIVWYSNGDMERYYTYNIFPRETVDNTPIFNGYGQIVFNNYLKEVLSNND